jgi:MFS family permease
MEQENRRTIIFISLAQFGMAASSHFVIAFMPFYIFKISPYSPRETLIWVGTIMGVTHLITAVASNFWGFLTSRYSPKLLFMRGVFVHTMAFLLMGFTSNLHVLFVLRVIQGVMGGVSTIGLIIVSGSSSREKIPADIGFFQTWLTLGLLIGPPLGTFSASTFGYQGAFLIAVAGLMTVLVFCHLYVKDVPLPSRGETFMGRRTINRNSVLGWLLCFSATVQLMFLPSILPKVLEDFHVEKTIALKWAGVIIMLYTATATLGTYFWTKIARRFGKDRIILWLVLSGTLLLVLLSLSHGIIDFVVIRMIQTGLIAACIPLVISIFAANLRGGTIGFLNSGRFAGSACGPIIATSVLAFSNLTATYLVIGGITLLTYLGFRLFSTEDRQDPGTAR